MKKFFVAVSLLSILSCSKSGDEPGENPDPNPNPGGNNTELTITTITPNSAEVVPVTINGTGFHTTPANNTVSIGGLQATVTAATETSLSITLPANLPAGDHEVKVMAKGKTATKANGFHLIGWIVSNFAGSGATGFTDAAGDAASFTQPKSIAMDAAGNFYVSDLHKIRKITPQGVVSTLAGDGGPGADDGTGAAAKFRFPAGIAVDATGNLYVADGTNHLIRKITPGGEVTTLAGKAGIAGEIDDIGEDALFSAPYGITLDPTGGFLFVGDNGNDKIRKISLATREVTTVAGDGTRTRSDNANPLLAGIPGPGNLAFDADGNLIITEKGAGMLRKMLPNGAISTIGNVATTQDANIQPTHLVFDRAKNIYVTMSGSSTVRKYQGADWVNFAGGAAGTVENGAANIIQFDRPEGIALVEDAQGNKTFYVVDAIKKKIKKISKQ